MFNTKYIHSCLIPYFRYQNWERESERREERLCWGRQAWWGSSLVDRQNKQSSRKISCGVIQKWTRKMKKLLISWKDKQEMLRWKEAKEITWRLKQIWQKQNKDSDNLQLYSKQISQSLRACRRLPCFSDRTEPLQFTLNFLPSLLSKI